MAAALERRFPTGPADDPDEDTAEPPRDPRWAALDALTFDEPAPADDDRGSA